MAYISSENIKVFPSIGRNPNIDADAELMNEGNISNIIRSLCRERKSYVLSKTWAAPFEFVIYGFYFKVTDISSLSYRPLYAHITLKENTGNYQLLTISNSTVSNNSLQSLDQTVGQSSQFQGVLFDSNPSGGTHTLQLLDAQSNVPATSLLHTETNEILNAGTSNYINESFTTTSLNATNATTGTLTVTGTTTLSGKVNAPGQTISASIFEGNLTGNLTTARNISLSGDISGNVNFDASKDVTINTEIGSGKVGTNELADNAVASGKVQEGAITNDKIANDAVTHDKIVNEAIKSDKIAPEGITTGNIKDGAITLAKMAGNSVGTNNIVNSAITSEKILEGAVTRRELATDAVTTDKIINNAVTTDKLDENAVTSEKIMEGAVTRRELATDAVTTDKIMGGAVTTEKIGFGVTMTLTVNDTTLVLSLPKLEDK